MIIVSKNTTENRPQETEGLIEWGVIFINFEPAFDIFG